MCEIVRNIDLEVREALAQCLNLTVDEIFSDRTLAMPPDDSLWFWNRIEEIYGFPITRAQKASLRNVGQLIEYIKLRRAI